MIELDRFLDGFIEGGDVFGWGEEIGGGEGSCSGEEEGGEVGDGFDVVVFGFDARNYGTGEKKNGEEEEKWRHTSCLYGRSGFVESSGCVY